MNIDKLLMCPCCLDKFFNMHYSMVNATWYVIRCYLVSVLLVIGYYLVSVLLVIGYYLVSLLLVIGYYLVSVL